MRRTQYDKLLQLTPQELKIVPRVSQSLTNSEVAQELFVSPKTIETHCYNIYKKLGVRNRGRLAHWYYSGGKDEMLKLIEK
jgi:DNA-binding CsgD family transcriptional regulator